MNKQSYFFIFYSVIILLLISCSKKEIANDRGSQENTNQQDTTTQNMQKGIVVIQPFEGTSSDLVSSLYKRLEPIVPEVRLNEPIDIPESALYSETNRCQADSLIRFLWNKSTHSSVVIGITESVISRASNGYQDFEIIGLAFRPGHSCVISTHLFGGENVEERLFKSAMHELAHTQGLKHCERETYCYMKGAKKGEVYPIDDLTSFCSYCTAFLRKKRWNLK